MRILKEVAINLLVGLNVFILFFLVFENQIEIPAVLKTLGRMHPLLLHFPIVLLILAIAFEIFKKQFLIEEGALTKVTGFLLFSGALTSALTVVLGLFLSQEEGYTGETLQWHKWTGVAVSFCATILLRSYYQNSSPKVLRPAMVLVFLLVLVTGHFGASLTHGEDFITAPLQSPASAEKATDLQNALVFNDLVRPVLKEKCYSCHNPDKAKGQLILTDSSSIRKGGKTGKLLANGKSGESLLVERLLLDIDHKHRMPPKGKPQLTDNEIALIKAWVEKGSSFSQKLADIPATENIHSYAASLYGGATAETYSFPAADESTVTKLSNSYRLVSPVAYESPGLDVTLFNSSAFSRKSLEELAPIASQIVHLNVSGMPVTDEEIPLLVTFKNLRQLNLNYTKLTDNGVQKLSGLTELRSLMLTGTGVTAKALAALAKFPKLKHVYAWNTPISSAVADSALKKFPALRIETGFKDDGKDTLTLNDPVLLPKNAFFRKNFSLNITHPIGGTDIRFTMDGTVPDSSATTQTYKKPIPVSRNVIVKAKAVKKGWASSKTVEKSYQQSAIKPDTFFLHTFPDVLHKGRGVPTLFDLAEGSTDVLYASDGNWLGYRNQDFVIEMAFKKPVNVKEATLSSLISVRPESFPPSEVELWVSYDGDTFVLADKVKTTQVLNKKSPIARNMISCFIKSSQPVSRLKIIAHPLKKMPAWHEAKGKPAWFFVDEILLN